MRPSRTSSSEAENEEARALRRIFGSTQTSISHLSSLSQSPASLPSGNHEITGGKIQTTFARRIDEGEILVGKLQDGDAREVDLLPPRQLQQQIARAFETLDIEGERRLAQRGNGDNPVLFRSAGR